MKHPVASSYPSIPRDDRLLSDVQIAKKFPPYVYSTMGALIHRVEGVTMRWYELISMDRMVRLDRPLLYYRCFCGMNVYGWRAGVCMIPDPNAVLCGRCHGRGATIKGRWKGGSVTFREAKLRRGCIATAP